MIINGNQNARIVHTAYIIAAIIDFLRILLIIFSDILFVARVFVASTILANIIHPRSVSKVMKE